MQLSWMEWECEKIHLQQRGSRNRGEKYASLCWRRCKYTVCFCPTYTAFLERTRGNRSLAHKERFPPQILCFRFFTAPYLLFFSRQCATRRAHRMRRGLGERVKRGAGVCSGAPGRASSLSAIEKTRFLSSGFLGSVRRKTGKYTENRVIAFASAAGTAARPPSGQPPHSQAPTINAGKFQHNSPRGRLAPSPPHAQREARRRFS